MAALVVVMMLLGAFLATRQSFLAISRNSGEKQSCRDAVRSLADYCRFRLEGKESWARAARPGETVEHSNASGQVVFTIRELSAEEVASRPELVALPGLISFEGRMAGSDVNFLLSVVNNLSNELPNEDFQVGAKSCRLMIHSRRGSSAEKAQILLRKAAFFDSTVAASGNIDIDSATAIFSSEDALRNQIRSLSKVLLPDTQSLLFSPDPDAQTPEKGSIWAASDISVGGSSAEAKLQEAASFTGGEFLANAPTNYSVPKLKKQDIDMGTDKLGDPKPVQPLEPITYVFAKRQVEFQDISGGTRTQEIPILEIRKPPSDRLLSFHYMESAVEQASPNTVSLVDGSIRTAGTPQTKADFDIRNEQLASLASATDEKARPTLKFRSDLEYRVENPDPPGAGRVPGQFKILAGDLNSAPLLSFYDPDPDPQDPKEGAISVEGDMVIQGSIENGGKLVAGGNIEMIPKDVAFQKREAGEDVAIYAGGNFLVQPLFTEDQTYLNDPKRAFSLRGLVYAEGNFTYLSDIEKVVRKPDGTTKRVKAEYKRKIYVEGALVARNGEVLVDGSESVELKYNPSFLDDLLEKSFNEDNIQLEEIVWRPF